MNDWSDFDLDFTYGAQGENLVKDLLMGGYKVEVKRDRRWIETGNVYIETSQWSRNTHNWVESGIMKTKSDYWAFVLESMVVIIPIHDLRKAVDTYGRATANTQPPNPSRGFLIRVEDLVAVYRGK